MQGPWQERATHCPVCGSTLIRREIEERSRRVCPDCDFVLYHGPASASAAVVVRERELLLVRRRIEPYRGFWGFPAGYQEYGETAEQTAVRETEEETGIRIEITGFYGLLHTTDDPRKRANLAVYFARPVAGRARVGQDCIEVGWFSLDAVPEPICFENNRKILADLQQRFPRGPISWP